VTERRSTAKDAGKRARDRVNDKYAALEGLKNAAVQALDDVLGDGALSGHHRQAQEHKARIRRHWKSIGKMTRSVRGANHPVIAYMLEQGNQAHRDYQDAEGKCDVTEFSMVKVKGRADCIKAEGTTCTVIELKPDNDRAIKLGKLQATRYVRELRSRGDAYKDLVAKDRKFAACTKFRTRVDCYTLCPTIGTDGEFERAAPSWRSDC
jgi:hypothetical protein